MVDCFLYEILLTVKCNYFYSKFEVRTVLCTPKKIVQKKSEIHFGLTYLNGPLSGLNFEIAQSLNLLRNFS